MKISLKSARNLAINSQFLQREHIFPKGKEGTAQIIEKLGYVQIDTISVIERAHHHTLWTRNPDHQKDFLNELQADDKRIFEYWGHAASLLPMKDFRFYLPMKQNYPGKSSWNIKVFEKHKKLFAPIMKRIKEEGPLSSADFEHPEMKNKNSWWEWKPSKVVLEQLFLKGDLMVKERQNFRKVFDLTERVLPDDVDLAFPSEEELGMFFVNRAINSYGLATEKEILNHLDAAGRSSVRNGIELLIEAGEIQKVEIETIENKTCYIDSRSMQNITEPEQIHILSPFDNFVIQRERMKTLFNFDYTLECYVPAKKRKFGYFVLPVLWKNQFIGRIDIKAERKKKIMIIRNLLFEPDFDDFEEILPHLRSKLISFSDFNNCTEIVVEKVKPRRIGKCLTHPRSLS